MKPGPCIERFSFKQKLVFRLAGLVFPAVGMGALFSLEQPWGVVWGCGYVAVSLALFFLVIVPKYCAWCPYPYEKDDCLLFPAGLVYRFHARKSGPMPLWDAAVSSAAVLAITAMPQPALYRHWLPPLLFWASWLTLMVGIALTVCPRCGNDSCPCNPRRRARE